jgi:hypothetical protein
MRDTWSEILDAVLRPARPHLERCLRAREDYLAARQLLAAERVVEVARCVRSIDALRTAVFASNDGVVTRRMTELEREWRRLTRGDPDAGLMDLWARIAAPSWIDRKLWRDSAPAARLDAAIALAADAEGVDAAESAIDALRSALAGHGTKVGPRVRWLERTDERDAESAVALLAEPLRAAREGCPVDHRTQTLERAHRVERKVHEDALARFPARPGLGRDLAHAAFVDVVWRASSSDDAANPVTALRALWRTGYVLSEVTPAFVTLEIPPLYAG